MGSDLPTYTMNKTLAIIPARGGSKRIPGKNIKPFCGKPIIAYPIELALKSGLFSEVMVSTDDENIAEIARGYGASVPFLRSAKNSDDFATTFDVLAEVFEAYAGIGETFGQACCIYATTPLITHKRLLEGHQLLTGKQYDAVFPVLEFSFPILRSLKRDNSGRIEMNWPENLNVRSQDLPKAYHDAGQFYWFDVAQILKKGKILTNNTGGIVIDAMEAQDIDTLSDWEVAEFKFNMKERI
jgi:pseudaminic acid cytidylyltransferase